MRTLTPTVLLASLVLVSFHASAQSGQAGLAARVAELEAQVEELTAALAEAQDILQFVHIEADEINGLAGPHWIIEGANVHVRSGSGNTFDGCGPRDSDFPNCKSLTGLGNLIVGYNERAGVRGFPGEVRTGSHNLVVGHFHSYTSFAGLVAGGSNAVTGSNASVSGGTDNEARGSFSSISGGHRSVASGDVSSVSGGQDRSAPDDFNWAAGSLLEPN